MPFPKALTRFNKQVTNKFVLLFSRWIPPLAVIKHRGRLSGRTYCTPIMVFPINGGYVLALTYGRDVDWVKNLLASGRGSMEYQGLEIPLHSFSFITYDEVKNLFPFWFRILLQLISVEDCLIAEKRESAVSNAY